MTLSVWMAPTLAEGPPLVQWAARRFLKIALGALGLVVLALCFLLPKNLVIFAAVAVHLPLLLLELPTFWGWLLSAWVNRLAPGLRMKVGACRLALWVDRTDRDLERAGLRHDDVGGDAEEAARPPPTLARTRLAICADVDGFALQHPADAGYAHADFLSARSVRVQLSVDHRLLDGLANWALGRVPMRWSPFPASHAALRRARDFEPTRLGAVRIDVLRVDHARCAFDHAETRRGTVKHLRECSSVPASSAVIRIRP